ncbi:unnamed protein product [Symbiodinium sp. CCMP2592]|nr:unnamed protein product [Symbiodinium sp. CCMP2592]
MAMNDAASSITGHASTAPSSPSSHPTCVSPSPAATVCSSDDEPLDAAEEMLRMAREDAMGRHHMDMDPTVPLQCMPPVAGPMHGAPGPCIPTCLCQRHPDYPPTCLRLGTIMPLCPPIPPLPTPATLAAAAGVAGAKPMPPPAPVRAPMPYPFCNPMPVPRGPGNLPWKGPPSTPRPSIATQHEEVKHEIKQEEDIKQEVKQEDTIMRRTSSRKSSRRTPSCSQKDMDWHGLQDIVNTMREDLVNNQDAAGAWKDKARSFIEAFNQHDWYQKEPIFKQMVEHDDHSAAMPPDLAFGDCSEVRSKAMSQHWTIDDFIAELGHLDSLAQNSPNSTVVQSMTNAFIARIQAASNWTSAGIVAMLEKANSMQADVKPSLVTAIESLNTMTGSHLRFTSSGQKVLDFSPYLTSMDWECMSGGIVADSMSMLAKRMRSMGTSAKECLDFKTILHAAPMPATHGAGVLVYPNTPAEMGQDWLLQAHGHHHGLAGRTIQLAHWSKAIPMRSTSSLLKPMPNPAQARPSDSAGDGHALAGVAGALCQFLNNGAPSAKAPAAASQLALQDGHAGHVQFIAPGQSHAAPSTLALPSSEPSHRPVATPARAPSVHAAAEEAPEANGCPMDGKDEDSHETDKNHAKTLEDWEKDTFEKKCPRLPDMHISDIQRDTSPWKGGMEGTHEGHG